jgi:hypothetical protein
MSLASVVAGKDNERDCAMFFASIGCKVFSTSSPGVEKGKRKRRGTMRTPGTPDLLVFHEPTGLFFFWEAKAGRAVLTKEQSEFRRLAIRCSERFGSGDLETAKVFAHRIGICEYDERTGLVTRVVAPC